MAGCTAVDDFSKFNFSDDGGPGDGPSGPGDMRPLPGFGQPCTDLCAGTLKCFTTSNGVVFNNGMCTHECMPKQAGACNGFGGDCAIVSNSQGGVYVCMPPCPANPTNCRNGYMCCTGPATMTTLPVCAPVDSEQCVGH
jgi:hypothetical protein